MKIPGRRMCRLSRFPMGKNLKHIPRTDNNDISITKALSAFGENDLDICAINDGKNMWRIIPYTDEKFGGAAPGSKKYMDNGRYKGKGRKH